MTTRPWIWLGDHLAVDLANTVIRRTRVMTELLVTPQDLAVWLEHERDRVPVPPQVDEALLSRVIELRDATLRLVYAAHARAELPAADVAAINRLAVETPVPRVLGERAGTSTTAPPRSGDPTTDLLATLAAAVVDLLSDPDLHDLAFCDAPSCGQFFHRRRSNQTWCVPACGDRARAARHHERTRRATTGGEGAEGRDGR